MVSIVIIGGGNGGKGMLRVLSPLVDVNILGISDVRLDAPGVVLAKELGIRTSTDMNELLRLPNLDIVIDVTGNEKVNQLIMENKLEKTHVIYSDVARLMYSLVSNKEQILDELGGQAQQIAAMAEDLTETITSIPATINQITDNMVQHSKELEGAVLATEKHLKETDEVINFIKKVADQTKLLGLNAAIEAARAGDHGRGFGVVANEVRKLAEDSVVAAKNIGAILQNIESSIQFIIAGIERTALLTDQQVTSSEQISTGVGQLTSMADEMKEFAHRLTTIA